MSLASSESIRDEAGKQMSIRQSSIHGVDTPMVDEAPSGNSPSRLTLQQKLAEARRDLLDLTLRNQMLNFRMPKNQGVNLDARSIDEVYGYLVRQHASLGFIPSGENNPSEEEMAGRSEEMAGRPQLVLSAPYTGDQLKSRLLRTFRTARTSMEEQGANTLFLALGFLEWYEAESSDKPLMAPLILVPVVLERDTSRDQFTVKLSDEEVVENLSLQYKLKVDFRLDLPALELDDAGDRRLAEYTDAVAQAVAYQKRWKVHADRLLIGFFSFGKYLMFRDLEGDLWPETASPLDSDLLASLLVDGFQEEASEIPDDARIDDVLPIWDMQTVLDADSSQLAAVVDVARGRNLVIQGPPGTGKSQTITNVIARAVLDGKTVLFVAEKMAALEVVKSRLEQVGLGPACLELHSNKTNKRQLLLELERTWELQGTSGQTNTNALEYDIQLRKLNEYVDALHATIAESGVTPYLAMGCLVQWRERMEAESWPAFEVDTGWGRETFVRHRELLHDVQQVLKEVGVPEQHPFWGCHLTELPVGATHAALVASLEQAVGAMEDLHAAWLDARASLQIPLQDAWSEVDLAVRVLHLLATAPDLAGVDVHADAWADVATWRDVAVAMRTVHDLRQKHDASLLGDTWAKDLATVRNQMIAHASFFGRMSVEYRRARAQAMACLRVPRKQTEADLLAWLNDVIRGQETLTRILRQDGTLKQLLGGKWHGTETDWQACAAVIEWMANLHRMRERGEVPEWTFQLANQLDIRTVAANLAASLTSAMGRARSAVQVVVDELQYRARDGRDGPEGQLTASIAEDAERLRQWQQGLAALRGIVLWNMVAARCEQAGLGPVARRAAAWPNAGESLVDAVTGRWYEALLHSVFKRNPSLAEFAGTVQSGAVHRFRALDEELQRTTQRLAVAAHRKRIPPRDATGGELSILRREMQKKTRHLSIRRLLGSAGHAVQGLKPVFMASPMSVATFFPPGSLHFDLVVFDEASQVQPVDAFGAILRGRQFVVVGDSKQLPPTHFFDGGVDDDEDTEDVEDSDLHTSDLESILGLCVSQGMPERMLRWHYRSRHESLVALSNAEFYDGRLVVFPSPDRLSTAKGLVLHRLEDTAYDRGKTRTNRREARAVAEAVMAHARAYVHGETSETLGVVAFSSAQADAIEDEVDRLRQADPTCESFFTALSEKFFVKNLETVQGDERDVILISVGYGRDKDGYLTMGFGPLGKAGGERRLNVLITRARVRCEVFTNLRSDDIDLHRARGEGIRVFKAFLRYCETGVLDVPYQSEREMDSPFEEAVRAQLVRLGYQVDTQVGSAGFFIDLAVVDPEAPGRYLLGIECDGATYHRSRSARDRDRLRQQVLEGLGWTLHRVWSTDWYRDQAKAMEKLEAALAQAKSRPQQDDHARQPVPRSIADRSPEKKKACGSESDGRGPDASGEWTETEQTDGASGTSRAETRPITAPYVPAMLHIPPLAVELHEVAVGQWADWIAQVVATESPVHTDVVVRRIADACGVRRVGNRIRGAYERALHHAVRSHLVNLEGAFLVSPQQGVVPMRSRADLPPGEKQMKYIAEVEIAAVMLALIDGAYGFSEEELMAATGRALGFLRVTQDMRDMLSRVLDSLQVAGYVRLEGMSYIRMS
ncbi:MAG: DUF3320 domain-containing protein [Alicyclobacillus sp.]|nr:DUF3320 domain-containing protein [Alicyclobacillus sp.]